MQIIPINRPELEYDYNEYLKTVPHANIWQTVAWSEFQTAIGRKSFIYVARDDQEQIIASAVITELPLKMGKTYWYISRGPLYSKPAAAEFLLAELKKIAPKHVIFIAFDTEEELPLKLKTTNTHTVQPQDTLLVDLTLSEEDILTQMKQKGRYNVRLSKKKGVEIKESKSVEDFYNLLQATTERDGFSGWGKAYYKKMLTSLGNNCLILNAEYEDEVIASGIFTFYGEGAVYYYGASGNAHRNLMAPYLLQYTAMLEGKKRGCQYYDFLGIAPEGASPSHAWAGVTDFKLKFGGTRKHYPNAQKIVLNPIWDKAYNLYKKIR